MPVTLGGSYFVEQFDQTDETGFRFGTAWLISPHDSIIERRPAVCIILKPTFLIRNEYIDPYMNPKTGSYM